MFFLNWSKIFSDKNSCGLLFCLTQRSGGEKTLAKARRATSFSLYPPVSIH